MPRYSMFVLFGSIARAPGPPTPKDNCRSNSGIHLRPPSILRHIPPPPVPMYMMFGFEGLIAIAETSPLNGKSFNIGLGPMGIHALLLGVNFNSLPYLCHYWSVQSCLRCPVISGVFYLVMLYQLVA